MNFYFTIKYFLFFTSLQRYFKYSLQIEIQEFSSQEFNSNTDLLFIFTEEKENPEILNSFSKQNDIKIILLGLDNNCSVNLLDFDNLKNNFRKVISDNDKTSTRLFTQQEIAEKLKNFFHSHGEDSLFEYLNWSVYYFREGPLQFKIGNISYQEYNENFLKIGLKNWYKFKSKYDNYKYFIKLYELNINADELDQNVFVADRIINEISEMNQEKVLKENEEFFKGLIETLNKINDFIFGICRNLPIGQSNIQNLDD